MAAGGAIKWHSREIVVAETIRLFQLDQSSFHAMQQANDKKELLVCFGRSSRSGGSAGPTNQISLPEASQDAV